MREVHPHPRLVRALVGGEADVAINAHERSSVGLGVGLHPRADLLQTKAEIDDEAQAGLAQDFLVAIAILQKPLAAVVALDLLQEQEQLWSDVGFAHKSRR